MKVRVIIGVSLGFLAISLVVAMGYGFVDWLFPLMSFVAGLATHEVITVSGCKNKLLTGISTAFAALLPVYYSLRLNEIIPVEPKLIYSVYLLFILILMVKMYSVTRFEHVCIALVSSLLIPMSICCITFTIRYCDSRTDIFSRSNGVFIVLMAMLCAWLSDSFALFIGMKFGKHKLSPNISPKKSVEGAIGGVVCTTIVCMIIYFVFAKWYFKFDTIKWWMALIFIPFTCVMGMLGDLAASVIKRNYGVKDFGTLLPGHGGAMDRSDSFLFTMPTAYLLTVLLTQ